MICKTVYYSGRVQGVGFRFTAQRIAQGYEVGGYVKNLPDGRVELVVEGDPQNVDGFLAEVAERMSGHIGSTEADDAGASGQLAGFEIRY
jgi:acylphosphatase